MIAATPPALAVRGAVSARARASAAVLTLAEVGLSLAQPWPLRWVVDGVLQPAAPRRRTRSSSWPAPRRRAGRPGAAGRRRRLLGHPAAVRGRPARRQRPARCPCWRRLQRQSLRFHGPAPGRRPDLAGDQRRRVHPGHARADAGDAAAERAAGGRHVRGDARAGPGLHRAGPAVHAAADLGHPPVPPAAAAGRPPASARPTASWPRRPPRTCPRSTWCRPSGSSTTGSGTSPGCPRPASPPASSRCGCSPGSARWSSVAGVVSTAVVLWFGAQRVLVRSPQPRRAAGVPHLPRLALQAGQVAVEAVPGGQQGRRRGRADRRGDGGADRHRGRARCGRRCRSAAGSSSATSPSRTAASRCCATSASPSRPGRTSPSSVRPAPARARSPRSSRGWPTSPPGRCSSTASTSGGTSCAALRGQIATVLQDTVLLDGHAAGEHHLRIPRGARP